MPKKEYIKYLSDFKNRSAKIPYRIYKKILENEYGAVERKKSHSGGSKRTFKIGSIIFAIHEPHNHDDPVGKWDHHNVLDLLAKGGLLDDEE